MSLYRVSPLPISKIEVFRQQSDSISIPSSPSYGIDAPLGLLASNLVWIVDAVEEWFYLRLAI
jgi:hypothetical protein